MTINVQNYTIYKLVDHLRKYIIKEIASVLNEAVEHTQRIIIPGLKDWVAIRTMHESWLIYKGDLSVIDNYVGGISDKGELWIKNKSDTSHITRYTGANKERRPDLANNPIQAARYMWLKQQSQSESLEENSTEEDEHGVIDMKDMGYVMFPSPIFVGQFNIYDTISGRNELVGTFNSQDKTLYYDNNPKSTKRTGWDRHLLFDSSVEQAARYIWLQRQKRNIESLSEEENVGLPSGPNRSIFLEDLGWEAKDISSQYKSGAYKYGIYDEQGDTVAIIGRHGLLYRYKGNSVPESDYKIHIDVNDEESIKNAMRYVYLMGQTQKDVSESQSLTEYVRTIYDDVVPKHPKDGDVVVFHHLDGWEAVRNGAFQRWDINDRLGRWQGASYKSGSKILTYGIQDKRQEDIKIPNLLNAVRYVWLRRQKPKQSLQRP